MQPLPERAPIVEFDDIDVDGFLPINDAAQPLLPLGVRDDRGGVIYGATFGLVRSGNALLIGVEVFGMRGEPLSHTGTAAFSEIAIREGAEMETNVTARGFPTRVSTRRTDVVNQRESPPAHGLWPRWGVTPARAHR